ncbi:DUF4132 domain-containing protein [Actinoallomurus sp. NPDC050550]|uniref:DUF4132 domain-containing protein n=1 Tax=Actinoallomurus sp. NPDC050550 TaxID=3154937 RepID=UPI0033CA7E1F
METSPELPDEDAFVLPDAWRPQLHPRRGGLSAGPPAAPETGDGLTLELRSEIEKVLLDGKTDPDAADRGLAYLRGSVTPEGAAVVATALAAIRTAKPLPFAGTWIAEHGVASAACAFAELSTLRAEFSSRDERRCVRYALTGDRSHAWWASLGRPLRASLAAASDDEYAEAVERLAGYRGTPMQRVAVSYLVPTRQDWVDDCCANPPSDTEWSLFHNQWMLLCALGSAHQLDLLGGRLSLGWQERSVGIIGTLLEGVGPAAAPMLAGVLDDQDASSDHRRLVLDALVLLPADEAFLAMVDRLDQKFVQPAMLTAMRRFPVRALRLLAPASRGTSRSAVLAGELLRGHVRTNAEFTAAVLPAEARAVVESIRAAMAQVPDAPAEALPPVLVTPPWTRRRKAVKPVVIEGLTPPAERRADWAPGERETWRKAPAAYWRAPEETDWAKAVAQFRKGELAWYSQAGLFVDGPEEQVRPLVAGWRPRDMWEAAEWMRPVAARFELDALPVALHVARSEPANAGGALLPFLDTEAALLTAEWLMRLKTARRHALAWFGRHGVSAVPHLVPAALGKAGPDRSAAEGALRLLASRHGAEEVVASARAYGDDAAQAVETLLAADPLEVLPARMPKIGGWADPAALPQVLLRDRATALPTEATGHLLTMLAISRLEEAYAGLDIVRGLCDPGSLTAFSWAVFERWQAAGTPAKDGWALTQLGAVGDDETVRRLTPVIRAWPGEGGHSKAVTGLDVLAAIGTDVALMHLHGIAQKVKFKGLKARAQEKIQQVAAQLELTSEQLADRLVPDFGLTADGSMILDYGPRRFVVGFDEQLKPFVTDEGGKRRASLPKPGVKDDPDVAAAAYKRFAALKKDVRTVAADQIRRLEAAMVTRRRWSMAEFGEFFVSHPLVWHIARRLVWATEADGRTTTFRIAEDRTFADVSDDVPALPDSACIGLVHPLDLGDDLEAWAEVLADYEILQPFPQLGRAVHRLTDDEAAEGRLARFEGVTVPVGKVLGLERRGWRRSEPQDAGVERFISKQFPDGRHVVIDLDPGIAVGAIDMLPEQKLDVVWLADVPQDYWPSRGTTHRFGELDPMTASELLADLTELTEAAVR